MRSHQSAAQGRAGNRQPPGAVTAVHQARYKRGQRNPAANRAPGRCQGQHCDAGGRPHLAPVDCCHASTSVPARRQALLALLATLGVGTLPTKGAEVLRVGPDCQFATIAAALEAAGVGSTIAISPGLYKERLLLSRAVTLTAEAAGSVTVEWVTARPYEAVLSCTAACAVRGLTLRHSSPSVANNFAVFNQGGNLELVDCDVSSATGSGLASEGGRVAATNCSLHDCKGSGAVFLADLEGGSCTASLTRCSLLRNGLHGALAREGAQLLLADCRVSGNRQYGVLAQDSEVELRGTALSGNGKGGLQQTT